MKQKNFHKEILTVRSRKIAEGNINSKKEKKSPKVILTVKRRKNSLKKHQQEKAEKMV